VQNRRVRLSEAGCDEWRVAGNGLRRLRTGTETNEGVEARGRPVQQPGSLLRTRRRRRREETLNGADLPVREEDEDEGSDWERGGKEQDGDNHELWKAEIRHSILLQEEVEYRRVVGKCLTSGVSGERSESAARRG